jgi:predicted KAP-like P-loop ATPase
MDNTIISDLNMARLVDRLQLERDPATRASLKSLLVEEEDKLGCRIERLSNLQRYIEEGSRRMALQKALIENLVAKGHDLRLAERTFNNLVEIQRIFEQYRGSIFDAIDRNKP